MLASLPSSDMINYNRDHTIDHSGWMKLDLMSCVNMDEKQLLKLLSRVSQ